MRCGLAETQTRAHLDGDGRTRRVLHLARVRGVLERLHEGGEGTTRRRLHRRQLRRSALPAGRGEHLDVLTDFLVRERSGQRNPAAVDE